MAKFAHHPAIGVADTMFYIEAIRSEDIRHFFLNYYLEQDLK